MLVGTSGAGQRLGGSGRQVGWLRQGWVAKAWLGGSGRLGGSGLTLTYESTGLTQVTIGLTYCTEQYTVYFIYTGLTQVTTGFTQLGYKRCNPAHALLG